MYKVQVTHMEKMLTLYQGRSRSKASEMTQALRLAIAIGNGSGEVTLRVNDVADVVWSIKDGSSFLSLIGGASFIENHGERGI